MPESFQDGGFKSGHHSLPFNMPEHLTTETISDGRNMATCCSTEDLMPFSLSERLEDEQHALQTLLVDFDPNFNLFSTSSSCSVGEEPLQYHKRQVSFDHLDEPSSKVPRLSPVDEEIQRQERNKLWKQSLKRSMFGKSAPLANEDDKKQ
jgi:hypothetical protein